MKRVLSLLLIHPALYASHENTPRVPQNSPNMTIQVNAPQLERQHTPQTPELHNSSTFTWPDEEERQVSGTNLHSSLLIFDSVSTEQVRDTQRTANIHLVAHSPTWKIYYKSKDKKKKEGTDKPVSDTIVEDVQDLR